VKSAAFLLGVVGSVGLCFSASAQTIWSPKIDRTNGLATLVTFPALGPNTVTPIATIPVPVGHFVSGMEFVPDGRLFVSVQGPAGSMQQGIYSVNRTTGAATQVGAPVGLAANEVLTDLSWNPVTHRLTGMATPTSGGLVSRLLNFDIHTGAVVSTATINSNVNVLHVGLTCRPNGEYLFMDVYNEWVSHKVGDNAVWLGNVLSFTPAYNQGIGTDFQTGTIWYASYKVVNALQGTGQPALRTVNPTTGVDTLIGNLAGGSNALYTDAAIEPFPSSCPADVTHNGVVEDADFVIFAVQYDALECGTPAMTNACSSDFNFDGVVDDTDFVIFAAAYDALVCP